MSHLSFRYHARKGVEDVQGGPSQLVVGPTPAFQIRPVL
jgi:hypothetical protein